MKGWPLSRRLMAWSAVLASVALALAATGTCMFLHHELLGDVDRDLALEAQKFYGSLHIQGPDFAWPDPQVVMLWLPVAERPWLAEARDRDGHLLFQVTADVATPLKAKPGTFHTETIGGRNMRLGGFLHDGVWLTLASDLGEVNEMMFMVKTAFLLTLPLVFGFVGLGGWWLMKKALQPLVELTSAAEHITADHLDLRLAEPTAMDEIGRLVVVLNKTFDSLQTSFHQATRFSGDASHELKTPLTILRSGIERMLQTPDLPPGHADGLSALLEQTTRLSSITENLLLLSRADAGRLQLELHPVEVCELAANCVEDARIMAEPAEIQIETEMPAEAWARAEPARLTQILLNLLSNAVKYNRPGGLIKVGITVGQAVGICVSNSGPGIAPADASRIFERFYRGDSTEEVTGAGLGLSIAHELARAHGGELALEESNAAWTVFRLTLQVVES